MQNKKSRHNSIKSKLRARLPALIGTAVVGATLFAGVAAASAMTEPVISGINATSTATTATISWMTDEGANAQVLYGTSTPYTASTTPTAVGSTTDQSVTLSGLMPSTTYHYAVVSVNADNNMNSSTDQTFMTLASTPTSTNTSAISTNASTGAPGSSFSLMGSGFWNSETVDWMFDNTTGTVNADTNGNFATTITVPSTNVSTDTPETISATGQTSHMTATTTFTVVPAVVTPPANGTLTTSAATGTPGSSFTLNGAGFGNAESVNVAFDGMTSTAMTNASGTFSSAITVPSAAVTTDTPETITATGVTSGTTASTTFTIVSVPTTPTSTPSSTPSIADLQNEIQQLHNLIAQLITDVQQLISREGNGNGNGNSGNGNGNGGSNLQATIDHVGPIRAGTSIDFTGRNWGVNEQVQVTRDGNVVTTARADGGGNFSTGSLPAPTTKGRYSYTFTGLTSGLTRTVTVTVTP